MRHDGRSFTPTDLNDTLGILRHDACVTSIPNGWLFLDLLYELGVPMK